MIARYLNNYFKLTKGNATEYRENITFKDRLLLRLDGWKVQAIDEALYNNEVICRDSILRFK